MREISLQLIDHSVSSLWWRELIKYFVQQGDTLEIRCWKEEAAEIRQASLYGAFSEDGNEISVKGIVTEELLAELLSEEPEDKSIYNKMTKYFTINSEHGQRKFCSAHYGTEMYLTGVSDDDIAFFKSVMKQYSEDDFSVYTD